MRQSLMTRLMLALVLTLTLALALAAQAAPLAQEVGPEQDSLLLPARVSLVHAAQVAAGSDSAVTITATQGGTTVIVTSGFTSTDTLPYLTLPSGSTTFRVYPGALDEAGIATTPPALTKVLSLQGGVDYTAVAIGRGNSDYPFDLLVTNDVLPNRGANEGLLRVIHAAPIQPNPTAALVDVISQPSGTVLLNDVAYGAVSAFIAFAAGSYDIAVVPAVGGAPIIDPPPLTVSSNTVLTLVATIDSATGTPTLVPLAYTPRAAAQVRVVHAAPFASGNATATPLLDPVLGSAATVNFGALNFGRASLYKTVSPGVYDARIVAGAAVTGTVALSDTLSISDGDKLTVVVIGTGSVTYPLELELLNDAAGPVASTTADVRVFHAAPFAPTVAGTAVDIVAEDGSPLPSPIAGLEYGDVTPYVSLPSGLPIDLRVVLSGTNTTVINPPALTFAAGSVQTVIAIGDGVNQPPGVVLLNDLQVTRNTYLPFVARTEP